jgi:hypothetical protein
VGRKSTNGIIFVRGVIKMVDKLMEPMELCCTFCSGELEQDSIQQLCFEPFNGVCTTCTECKAEFSLNMKIEIYPISEPEENQEGEDE